MREAFREGFKDLGSLAGIVSVALLLKEIALFAWVEKVPGKFTRGILRKGLSPKSTDQWDSAIEEDVIREKNLAHLLDQEKHIGTMNQYAEQINEAVKAKMSALN